MTEVNVLGFPIEANCNRYAALNDYDGVKSVLDSGGSASCFSLALAAHNGNLDMCKLIVESGVSPKQRGCLSAHYEASRLGHKDIVEYLEGFNNE